MLNIKEEFKATRVMIKHTVWKAPTEKDLEQKIYNCIVREIKKEAKMLTRTYGGKVTIAPFEEMKREYTPVLSRRKYSVSFVDNYGNAHKHYMTVEYENYGYVVD